MERVGLEVGPAGETVAVLGVPPVVDRRPCDLDDPAPFDSGVEADRC